MTTIATSPAVGARRDTPASPGRAWRLFAVLFAISQVGHLGEHVVQEVQLRIQHRPLADAHGAAGAALDVESVHLAWNAFVLLGAVLLLWRIGRHPVLWAAVAFAAWHLAEHITMMWTYITTGRSGAPGLLARGGHLGGGLPIARPDLHFLYNVVEAALVVAAAWVFVHRARPSR